MRDQLGIEVPRTLAELVDHLIANWEQITGTPSSDMFEESHFPEPVDQLIEESGVDPDEFQEAWSQAREDHCNDGERL